MDPNVDPNNFNLLLLWFREHEVRQKVTVKDRQFLYAIWGSQICPSCFCWTFRLRPSVLVFFLAFCTHQPFESVLKHGGFRVPFWVAVFGPQSFYVFSCKPLVLQGFRCSLCGDGSPRPILKLPGSGPDSHFALLGVETVKKTKKRRKKKEED